MSKLFTIKQASKILGFSTNTIYKYVSDGTIRATRSGSQGRFRITKEAIEEYLGSKLPSKEELTPTPTPSQPVIIEQNYSKTPLTLTAVRYLLIAALIFYLFDIFLNPKLGLTSQILRLILIAVFILLTYQFGGFRKNEPRL